MGDEQWMQRVEGKLDRLVDDVYGIRLALNQHCFEERSASQLGFRNEESSLRAMNRLASQVSVLFEESELNRIKRIQKLGRNRLTDFLRNCLSWVTR